ncbi:MAG: hypothetical protein JW943_15660 [Deltaproteobacteria bacterium]|nr:hypothetical protein [Deltaproteobacteria bacterium]
MEEDKNRPAGTADEELYDSPDEGLFDSPDEGVFASPDEDLYDSADSLFDFVGADEKTAIICEADDAVRESVANTMKVMEYKVTETSSVTDALMNMRYHTYDLIVINENIDSADPNSESVLLHLQGLPMSVRRPMFVVLVSEKFRTMDNMAAFNKSVNMIINTQNMDNFESIVGRGMSLRDIFYGVFNEAKKKTGRI